MIHQPAARIVFKMSGILTNLECYEPSESLRNLRLSRERVEGRRNEEVEIRRERRKEERKEGKWKEKKEKYKGGKSKWR